MDTDQQNPTPAASNTDHSTFGELRARNGRRRAVQPPQADRKQRIERVIEAARAHARLAKPPRSGHSRTTSG